MEKKPKYQDVTLKRGCIVNGEPAMPGTTHTVKVPDAQLLIHSGKAVPVGDDREEEIKAAAATQAKATKK
jgi:TATA-box binding protein (TBP) (component of TFIID and TFIIIB)